MLCRLFLISYCRLLLSVFDVCRLFVGFLVPATVRVFALGVGLLLFIEFVVYLCVCLLFFVEVLSYIAIDIRCLLCADCCCSVCLFVLPVWMCLLLRVGL